MRASPRPPQSRTPAGVLAAALRRRAAEVRGRAIVEYQSDPLGYVRDRIKIRLMPWQAEALVALANGVAGKARPRVAVRSGQKCGKTTFIIVAALWFYECFPKSTTYLCAAIQAQTENVLWKELGVRIRHARENGVEIGGKLGHSSASGMRSADGSREIKGVSGRDVEALAGLSGMQLLIIDEASHLPEKKAQVFAGNMLGSGGALVCTSNPTRNSGPFYDAFHNDKDFWQTFHVDGEDVAAWQVEQKIRIPFTVNVESIAEAKERFTDQSPFWFLRVKGDWLRYETGRANPMIVIEAALARWQVAGDEGSLTIGYDPAGPTPDGDESAWAIVRGAKCVDLRRRRGFSEDAAVEETLALLRIYRKDDEPVAVHIDAEGPVGYAIYSRLRTESERRRLHDPANAFTVAGIKASSRYVRDKDKFERVRSELVWNLSQWLLEGAIPNDSNLQSELYEPTWRSLPSGQLESTPKTQIRDKLGRSPDSFDALALAVWKPVDYAQRIQEQIAERPEAPPSVYTATAERAIDPYSGPGYGAAAVDPYDEGGGRR